MNGPVVRRAAGIEAAADGLTLTGTVVVYGDIATVPGVGRERIEAGGLRHDGDIVLNMMHRRDRPLARTAGGSLVLTDSAEALTMRAALPDTQEARDTVALVRGRVLQGLSVEMRVERQRVDGGVRVIEQARLVDLGVVDRPAYPASAVEARRTGRGVRVAARIPTGKRVGCRCQGGGCDSVRFEAGAFREAVGSKRQILAVGGSYREPLAARSRGTVRLDTADDGSLAVGLVLEGEAAERVRELEAAAPVMVRPYLDPARSVRRKVDTTMIYDVAYLRAVIVGATDEVEGLDPAVIVEQDEPRFLERMKRWRPWL